MSNRRASLSAAASLALLLAACQPAPAPTEATFEVRGALGGEADPGFARAERPREFVFPDDHGPHPSFRNEWWYLTGNLESEAGRRFGFQITFFRIAISPTSPEADSGWATNQVWMGHFAITDAARREHHASERFARGALGLAGATSAPPRIWLEDWRLDGPTRPGEPWRLLIRDGEQALELELESQKRPVLQGDDGLSQKSAAPGNASYYYSLTRLDASGRLVSNGISHTVSGSAWMDREWSTSALGEDQAGWDWFALQLDGDEELMFYQLRKTDGSKDPHSRGSWVFADQRVMSLGPDDVAIEVLDTWLSPSGIRYPVRWRLQLGPLDRSYEVVPVLADQEMDVSVRYWEGAVDVLGTGGKKLGRGYVELAGYEKAEKN
jgi:predicted secreted hydrolase